MLGVKNRSQIAETTCSLNKLTAIALLVVTSFITGCFSSEEGFNSAEIVGSAKEGGDGNEDFPGCISGAGSSTSTVDINYQAPASAVTFTVARNGLSVFVTSVAGQSGTVTDFGLTEGQTYTYTCSATFKNGKSKTGTNILTVGPLSINPPTFGGIVSATATSGSTAALTWNTASGVFAQNFRVWATPGTTVDFSSAPAVIAGSGALGIVVSGLGDEIPYAFGVRACSAAGNCDTNTVTATATTLDGGMPGTVGATVATPANGKIDITAPWIHTQGGVLRRYVYQRTGPTGGTNLADYTLVQTKLVTDLANVPTTLNITAIADSTTYHFIVVDEDPSGVDNGNRVFVSVNSGDMTPPVFLGISNLVVDTPADTVLKASFTAIDHEITDPAAGASHYVVYSANAPYPTAAPDACSSGTEVVQLDATLYTSGLSYDYFLTGLNPRSNYSICIKARDSAGNFSTGSNSPMTAVTRDLTPPQFDGVQTISYNNSQARLEITWNPSTSSDIANYKVRLWKNVFPPTGPDITDFLRDHATYSTGANFTSSDYSYTDNDTIYTIVEACDNADTIPGGSINCTVTAFSGNRNVTVPDVTPPPSFVGVQGAGAILTPAEGQLDVRWFEPVWTADYHGFKVYDVGPGPGFALTLMKTCPCATPGACVTADTNCLITGLDVYRTYKLHVRAYDAAGNETAYLDADADSTLKQTTDTSAPSFISGLTIGAAPTFTLTWAKASDGQFDSTDIDYQVWRKVGTSFGDPFDPGADGALRTTVTSSLATIQFDDTGITEGNTYFYTICALDQTGNRTCDGFVQSFLAPDITPPVISGLTSPKVSNVSLRKWDLTWTMSDNSTSNPNLRVKIYKKIADTETTATTSDPVVLDTVGVSSFLNQTGPMDANKWISYLVEVRDQVGNKVSASINVRSDNQITVTQIARSLGTTAGGDLVAIHGTGFPAFDTGYTTASTAVDFSASGSDMITVPDHAAFDFSHSNGFSVEFWYKPSTVASNGDRYIIEKALAANAGGFYVYRNTNVLHAGFLDGASANDLASTAFLVAGTWYHIVISSNGDAQRIYVNGVQNTVSVATITLTNSTGKTLHFGDDGKAPGAGANSSASLDDVSIYNYGMPASVVKRHYEVGSGAIAGDYRWEVIRDGAIAYWNLDESAGTVFDDINANEHDGSCVTCPTLGVSGGMTAGVHTVATVTIGGNACTDVDVVDPSRIVCRTPTGTTGLKSVTVSGPEGSAGTLADSYTYYAPATSPHICDNPGSWGSEMAGGTGIISDPYIICSFAHLDMLRNDIGENGATDNYQTGDNYYAIRTNIDMEGQTINQLGPSGDRFSGIVDGEGHMLYNMRWHDSAQLIGGYFGDVKQDTVIKNLGIYNGDVLSSTNASLFVGYNDGATPITFAFMDKVWGSGVITGLVNGGHSGILANQDTNDDPREITNSFANVAVIAKMASAANAGTIGGVVRDTDIKNSHSYGRVIGANETQSSTCGGISGFFSANMDNNMFSGVIHCANVSAGIAASITGNSTTMDNLRVTDAVIHASGGAGGLFGTVNGTGAMTVSNCKVERLDLNATGGSGGIISSARYGNYTMQDCIISDSSIRSSGSSVGGLSGGDYPNGIGYTHTYLRNLITRTTIHSDASYAGGLTGRRYGGNGIWVARENVIRDNVTVTALVGAAGGIIGNDNNANDTTIQDNYVEATIVAGNYAGGFIGDSNVKTGHGGMVIERNVFVGTVNGPTLQGGGWGRCSDCTPIPTVNDNFWDTDVSSETTAFNNAGAGGIAGGIKGETTVNMQTQGTFTNFDFVTTPVWKMPASSYPKLNWEP